MRAKRIERMKSIMRQQGIGVLLTFDPHTIRYLIDARVPYQFRWMENFFVILPVNGDPHFYGYGTSDFPSHAPWLNGKIWSSISFTRVYTDISHLDPTIDHLLNVIYEHSLEGMPVAIDGCTTILIFQSALERLGIQLVDGRECVNLARLIKCEEELQCLRHSARTTNHLFQRIQEIIRPGITTHEVIADSIQHLPDGTAEEIAEHMIASGPQTNPPYVAHVNRRLEEGDLVHVALNCNSYHGYCTYYYRTFCCGHAGPEQRDAYEKTYRLLKESFACIKAGVPITDLWTIWHTHREQWGYGPYDQAVEMAFCHGIGLASFESPCFTSSDPGQMHNFEEGMVLDLYNWGGYKGGSFGIRIGENLIVTKDGYELLSDFPADHLIECGID